MNGRIVILGATSGIGRAVAEGFIANQCDVVLCGRHTDALNRLSTHLKTALGKEIPYTCWDVNDTAKTEQTVQSLFSEHTIRGIFCSAGIMPSQENCLSNTSDFLSTIHTNFTATALAIETFAHHLENQGHGFISVVSSVAGDRGRQSNYVYGSSKAGLTAFLSGLRNRLHKKGILVQTVKPGFVRTRMTEHLSDGPLMAKPANVAKDIIKAIERKKDVIYTPFYWKFILGVIQYLPEFIFKRLSL